MENNPKKLVNWIHNFNIVQDTLQKNKNVKAKAKYLSDFRRVNAI